MAKVREKLAPVSWVQKVTTLSDYKVLYSRADGQRQSISSLNSVGGFVPGIFRHNNVVIEKSAATSTSGFAGPFITKTIRATAEGHIAAAASNFGLNVDSLAGYAPRNGNAEIYALNKAFAKSKEPDFDLGMIFGELGETINGLVHPMKALRKYVKGWNKLQRSNARRSVTDTMDMLTGSWLEWSYGIKPLISTIQSGIDYFNSTQQKTLNKLNVSRATVKLPVRRYIVPFAVSPGMFSLKGSIHYTVHQKQSCQVYWMWTKQPTWQSTLAIDATSIASILWEKTTLSFVWDWFQDVGSWLAAIRPVSDRAFIGTSTSMKSVVEGRVTDLQASALNLPFMSTGSTYEVKYEKLDRWLGRTLPSLMPAVNPKLLGLTRSISGLSLLWQRMPSRR